MGERTVARQIGERSVMTEPRTNNNLTEFPPDTPREQSTQSTRRLMGKLEEAERDLALVRQHLTEAVKRGLSDSASGMSSGGERVGGSKDHDEQMLNRVEQVDKDPARRSLAQLSDAVLALAAWSSNARHHAFQLQGLDPKKAKQLLGETPAICICCGRDVWLTPQDRIRKGRCSACWEYQHDYGKDCSQELHDRRAERRERVEPVDPKATVV